jgi:hypothetical protein
VRLVGVRAVVTFPGEARYGKWRDHGVVAEERPSGGVSLDRLDRSGQHAESHIGDHSDRREPGLFATG